MSQDQAAFTLLEVLVALAVSALLCAGLLAAQGQTLKLALQSRDLWDDLNLSQEILAERYPDSLREPSGDWLAWKDDSRNLWRLDAGPGPFKGQTREELRCRLGESELLFVWPRYASRLP